MNRPRTGHVPAVPAPASSPRLPVPKPAATAPAPPPAPCPRCEGCGRVADTPDAEPWSYWANLPAGSDLAVAAGLVRPLDCPECDGTGHRRPHFTARQQALYDALGDVLADVEAGRARLADPAQLDYILDAIDDATEKEGPQ